jgi:hypothetical protein
MIDPQQLQGIQQTGDRYAQWVNQPVQQTGGGTNGQMPLTNGMLFNMLPNSERSQITANGGATLTPDQQAYAQRLYRLNTALWNQGLNAAGNNFIPYLQQKYGEGRVPDQEIAQIEQRLANPQTAQQFAQEASASLVGAQQAFSQGGQPALQQYMQGVQGTSNIGKTLPAGGQPQAQPYGQRVGTMSLSQQMYAQNPNNRADPMSGTMVPTWAGQGMGGWNPAFPWGAPTPDYTQRPMDPMQGSLPGMGPNAQQNLAAALGQQPQQPSMAGGMRQAQPVPQQQMQQRGPGSPPPSQFGSPFGNTPIYMGGFGQPQRAPSYYAPPPPPPQISANSQFRQNPMDRGATAPARPMTPGAPTPQQRPSTPPPPNPYQSGLYAPNTQVRPNPYQAQAPASLGTMGPATAARRQTTGALLPQGLGR